VNFLQLSQKLPFGIVGGAHSETKKAFFGPCHIQAAQYWGGLLTSGVFSRNTTVNNASGMYYGAHAYDDVPSMIAADALSDNPLRFISVATPNISHCTISAAALAGGKAVMCEKPVGVNLQEAIELSKLVKEKGLPFGLTYTYRGYPMTALAAYLIRQGEIGDIFDIQVDYPQGWLLSEAEPWRTDPEIGGPGGVLADIGGTHAYDMMRYLTGKEATRALAILRAVIPGRKVPDHAEVHLRFSGDVSGSIRTSQVMAMCENDISFTVSGTKGRITWSIKDPNSLYLYQSGKPTMVYRAAEGYLPEEVKAMFRLPPGHPEGNEGALANVYGAFMDWVVAHGNGDTGFNPSPILARIDDGLESMALIEAALQSQATGNTWVPLPTIRH
jgi:predicted dehydrogenase